MKDNVKLRFSMNSNLSDLCLGGGVCVSAYINQTKNFFLARMSSIRKKYVSKDGYW